LAISDARTCGVVHNIKSVVSREGSGGRTGPSHGLIRRDPKPYLFIVTLLSQGLVSHFGVEHERRFESLGCTRCLLEFGLGRFLGHDDCKMKSDEIF